MPGVLVLGSSNTDLVIRGERLPKPGETVMGSDYFQAFGGKGANQAVAAARAGADVTFIAAVGDDDFGRAALDQYRAERINIDHVKIVPGRPSGVALILVGEGGQNMIAVHPGANADLTPEDIDALPEEVFTRNRVFVAQLETPTATVLAGLRRAKRAGLLTILNPAPAQARMALFVNPPLLEFTDIVVPNEVEAEGLTGYTSSNAEGIANAAISLARRGPRGVILTLGERGCAVMAMADWIEGTKPIFKMMSAIKVKPVDAVAAGDAFVGALANRLAELDRPFEESIFRAAEWALHASAISVTRNGAQPSLPSRAEIQESFDLQWQGLKEAAPCESDEF